MLLRDTKIKGRPTEVGVYQSMAEVVDHIYEIVNDPKTNKRAKGYLTSYDRSEFVGYSFTSKEHWKKIVDGTWQEGVDIIDEMVRQLVASNMPKPISRKRRRVFDEYDGDELDYDRLRSGQMFWSRGRRISNPGPVTFTVIINASTNCKKGSREILWKGASGVAITHILEAAGYRVEVWLAEYARRCYTDGCDVMEAIMIKGSKDPLNIAALSTIIPGWFYRTGIFVLSASSIYRRRPVGCLGYPNYALTKEHVQEFTSDKNYTIVASTTLQEAQSDLTKAINQINDMQNRK